jgi:hypothetical protein
MANRTKACGPHLLLNPYQASEGQLESSCWQLAQQQETIESTLQSLQGSWLVEPQHNSCAWLSTQRSVTLKLIKPVHTGRAFFQTPYRESDGQLESCCWQNAGKRDKRERATVAVQLASSTTTNSRAWLSTQGSITLRLTKPTHAGRTYFQPPTKHRTVSYSRAAGNLPSKKRQARASCSHCRAAG